MTRRSIRRTVAQWFWCLLVPIAPLTALDKLEPPSHRATRQPDPIDDMSHLLRWAALMCLWVVVLAIALTVDNALGGRWIAAAAGGVFGVIAAGLGIELRHRAKAYEAYEEEP